MEYSYGPLEEAIQNSAIPNSVSQGKWKPFLLGVTVTLTLVGIVSIIAFSSNPKSKKENNKSTQ